MRLEYYMTDRMALMNHEENELVFDELCTLLGVEYDMWRKLFLREWARWEGTSARFNPLATTQTMAGSTTFNSVGVQNYLSATSGAQATWFTIDPTSYQGTDYYPNLRHALMTHTIDNPNLVAKELTTWGTTGFATRIANGWNPSNEIEDTELPTNNTAVYNAIAELRTEMLGHINSLNTAVWNHVNALSARIDKIENGANTIETIAPHSGERS